MICTSTCGSSLSLRSTPATCCMFGFSHAGEAAAQGAAKHLTELRQDRGELTVTIARRELRNWLRESKEGTAVEKVVGELLAKKGDAA